MPQLAVTLNLDGLDPERVEESCFEFGALAVTYTDQRDDPILEPAPGEQGLGLGGGQVVVAGGAVGG